ncbi:GLPGLI family protein [Chryseobacterium arthrosphaerae]|uniref:GLPGLI family protein n=1 Tax=Chryseobacterium arthrosphaerae TaxID=651561 RepID=UPI00242047B7|nr:GLPGLI family protein [Chryseobacterium arthrosphaerae]
MKNILVFLLLSQIIFAQNKRFMYQYTFIPDSTNSAHILKELMYLDITENRSLFFSRNKLVEDSIAVAEAWKGNPYIPNADILYKIEKKNNHVFFLISDYGLDKIRVDDDRKMNWKILQKRQNILGYEAQEALLNFAGRKWTAWFTTDIPVQDGPYKFHGLPGLILKIEDDKKSHVYELAGIKNIAGDIQYPDLNPETKDTNLTYSEFKEIFIRYRKDPAAGTRQLYMAGRIPDQTDTSGKFRTGAEIVRDIEQLSRERIKKDNNIIEIDLLKAVN